MTNRDMAAAQFKGVIATPVTPFNEDYSLDSKAVESNTLALLEDGAEGFVVCGSIGELPTLTEDEWEQVVKSTVAVCAGKVAVFATVGHTDMRVIRRMALRAAELGVVGIVVVPPFYFALSQQEVVQFYKDIDELEVPFIIYNHPGTGRPEIGLTALQEIAGFDHFAGLKEATDNGNEYMKKRALLTGRAHVLAAAESHLFFMAAAGTDGCLTAVSAFAPSFLLRYLDAFSKGTWQEARELNRRLMMFREIVHKVSATGTTGYLSVTKAALDIKGLRGGPPRPALSSLSEELRQQLRAVMKEQLEVIS